MTNEFEDKLTVQGGFPVIKEDDFHKAGGNPDADTVSERWYTWGLANAFGATSDFTVLFNLYVLNGKHPEIAAQQALDDLGVDWKKDAYLITEKGVDRTL